MNIDIIVQARMGSKRLPGKVLKPIMGRPMIEYTLESMRRCRNVRGIVSAVPTGDHELIKVCGRYGAVWTGPEKNVAARFMGAVRSRRPDAFVRICGDSPVIDGRMVADYVNIMLAGDYNLVFNVGGGFPHGQQMEIVGAEFFLANKSRLDREHVTPPLYALTRKKHMIALDYPSTDPSLVVDTQEDFDRVSCVIERAGGKPWEYDWRQLQDFAREPCLNQSN